MKVKISTWVPVGSGRPHEIIDAMVDCGLPSTAEAREINYEWMLTPGGSSVINSEIRFEWEEDR